MAKSVSKPSGKLSTKDVPETGGSGVSKTLQPGNIVIKINSIEYKIKELNIN